MEQEFENITKDQVLNLEPDNSRPYKEPSPQKILGEIQLEDTSESEPKKEYKEITLKFPKEAVGDEFVAKDNNIYREIKIKDDEIDDRRQWASFVAPTKKIHDDQYVENGMWLKLPAEGHTTIKREFIAGQDVNGNSVYQKEMGAIHNADLKKMVTEAYPKNNERMPLKERIAEKKKAVAENKSAEATSVKPRNPINRDNRAI